MHSPRDSEIPPLVEPDKNITIMSIENISYLFNIQYTITNIL
jgi:hypothetical protein